MNVAIFGVEPPSQIVAKIINQHYNPFLKERLGEKLDIVAFVTGGGRYRLMLALLATPRF